MIALGNSGHCSTVECAFKVLSLGGICGVVEKSNVSCEVIRNVINQGVRIDFNHVGERLGSDLVYSIKAVRLQQLMLEVCDFFA